jgi:hypothetical protein
VSLVALLFFRQIEKKTRLFKKAAILFKGIEDRLDGGLFFKSGLRLLRVVPEVRPGGNEI